MIENILVFLGGAATVIVGLVLFTPSEEEAGMLNKIYKDKSKK